MNPRSARRETLRSENAVAGDSSIGGVAYPRAMPAPESAFAALETGLEEKRVRVEAALRRLTVPGRSRAVEAAVESSLFAPAKRLRPILALMVADVLRGDAESVLPAACALEMVHTASLILDDDLLHQLYFVTWRALPRAIGYVAPGARTSSEDALVEIGRETVTIAGQRIPAWRFAFGTGATRRDIWIDSGKRLLRVSVPAQQIEGTRDLPPL